MIDSGMLNTLRSPLPMLPPVETNGLPLMSHTPNGAMFASTIGLIVPSSSFVNAGIVKSATVLICFLHLASLYTPRLKSFTLISISSGLGLSPLLGGALYTSQILLVNKCLKSPTVLVIAEPANPATALIGVVITSATDDSIDPKLPNQPSFMSLTAASPYLEISSDNIPALSRRYIASLTIRIFLRMSLVSSIPYIRLYSVSV